VLLKHVSGVLLALTIAALIAGAAVAAGSTQSADGGCAENEPPQPEVAENRLRLKPVDPKVIAYGSDRGVRTTNAFLTIIDDVAPSGTTSVIVGEPRLRHTLTRQDFPASMIEASATYSSRDDAVIVEVCTDLDRQGGFEPGTYEGTVQINDERFRADPIALTIEIKDQDWWWALVAALFGGLVGALWGTLSTAVSTWDRNESGEADVRAMLWRLTIIAGVIGVFAGLGLWLFDYVDAKSFRASWGARFDLAVKVFALTVALHAVVATIERILQSMMTKSET
jgi:hypothetical protein